MIYNYIYYIKNTVFLQTFHPIEIYIDKIDQLITFCPTFANHQQYMHSE